MNVEILKNMVNIDYRMRDYTTCETKETIMRYVHTATCLKMAVFWDSHLHTCRLETILQNIFIELHFQKS
jgi:hypothetical protein